MTVTSIRAELIPSETVTHWFAFAGATCGHRFAVLGGMSADGLTRRMVRMLLLVANVAEMPVLLARAE